MPPPERITLPMVSILSMMLSDPTGAWYGLELARAAQLRSGTVYPALARLEDAGWLTSSWEAIDPSVAGRPARRLYELTGVGERAANKIVTEHLERLNHARKPRRPRPRPEPRSQPA